MGGSSKRVDSGGVHGDSQGHQHCRLRSTAPRLGRAPAAAAWRGMAPTLSHVG